MRGQFSIDFFLVLSVIVAFLVVVYGVAVEEGGKTRLLDSAILSKRGVDSVSSLVEFVSLGGNYSTISVEVFIPREASCFYFNDTTRKISCVLSSRYLTGAKNRVEGRSLFASAPVRFSCGTGSESGWFDVNATLISQTSTAGQYVSVSCLKVT